MSYNVIKDAYTPATKEILSCCVSRHVNIPVTTPLPHRDDYEGIQEYHRLNWRWINYDVHRDHKPLAKDYAEELQGAIATNDSRRIQRLYAHLEALRLPGLSELRGEALWSRVAEGSLAATPFSEDDHSRISKYLMKRFSDSSLILEAMSGSWSYFPYSDSQEVVQLDCSPEMLRKHKYPMRTRLRASLTAQDDMESLVRDYRSHFDLISITLGFKYLENIPRVLRQLRELLKPNGKLIFIEHKYAGFSYAYGQGSYHPKNPFKQWETLASQAGYINPTRTRLRIKTASAGSYYALTACVE